MLHYRTESFLSKEEAQAIGHLTQLTSLTLDAHKDSISTEVMRALRPLRKLTQLGLGSTRLTESAVSELQHLDTLQELVFEDLAAKRFMRQIESLGPSVVSCKLQRLLILDDDNYFGTRPMLLHGVEIKVAEYFSNYWDDDAIALSQPNIEIGHRRLPHTR